MPKKRRELSEKIAAAIAHKALHALQGDLEKRFGFRDYRFTEGPGKAISGYCEGGCSDEVRDLWLFRGVFSSDTNLLLTYEVHVGIRPEDDGPGLRYERNVYAEVLRPGNGGIEYRIEVPPLGELGSVQVVESSEIKVPERDDDVLSGLSEILAEDHLGTATDMVDGQ